MDGPHHLPRYISLQTSDALEKPVLKGWLDTVVQHAPAGTVATVQKVDDHGSPVGVAIIHREVSKKHCYLIPLTRDLSDAETGAVVEAFATDHPEMDFDIETNRSYMSVEDEPRVTLDQERHLGLCMALAKQRHNEWMKERLESDWRYGPTFSTTNKTSPMLRPWDDLPARYRQPDLDAPQKMLDVLTDQGYVVVAKDDLKKLLATIQGGL